MIFIIFDVEVIFIYPVATVFKEQIGAGMEPYVLVELLVFVFVLVFRFADVWKKDDVYDLQVVKTMSFETLSADCQAGLPLISVYNAMLLVLPYRSSISVFSFSGSVTSRVLCQQQ